MTKGFSLVELLVVIAVITILSTVGATIYSNVRVGAQNQQRFRDLQSVKMALELYRNDNRSYPPTSNLVIGCSGVAFAYNGKTYLTELPKDPRCTNTPNRFYSYRALPNTPCTGTTCSSYVLCARKDGSTNYPFGDTKPSDCNMSCGDGICDVGISSP